MNLDELSKEIHQEMIHWWQDPANGQPIQRNKGELIALQHSELSECLEGERRGLKDDKLPQYPMAVVEQIDCMIRILDYLGGFYPDIDVQEVFDAKRAFNTKRADHSHIERCKSNGKKF